MGYLESHFYVSNVWFGAEINGDLSAWDTSKVTNMRCMFVNTYKFMATCRLDTSKVTDMRSMFYFALKFNVTCRMGYLKSDKYASNVYSVSKFNGNLSAWNTSKSRT